MIHKIIQPLEIKVSKSHTNYISNQIQNAKLSQENVAERRLFKQALLALQEDKQLVEAVGSFHIITSEFVHPL